jgi:hypothetical protein
MVNGWSIDMAFACSWSLVLLPSGQQAATGLHITVSTLTATSGLNLCHTHLLLLLPALLLALFLELLLLLPSSFQCCS